MLKVSLALSVLMSLTGSALAADDIVLDCSPDAEIGFKPTIEKIYIREDASVAIYQTTRGRFVTNIALSPTIMEVPTQSGGTRKASDGMFVGIANDGREIQVDLDMKQMVIQLSRSVGAEAGQYGCRLEKRLEIDFEPALEAIKNAEATGTTEFDAEAIGPAAR